MAEVAPSSQPSDEDDDDKTTAKLASREIVAGTPFDERETSRVAPLVRADPLLDDVAPGSDELDEITGGDEPIVIDSPDETACERPSRTSIRRLALSPLTMPLPAHRDAVNDDNPKQQPVAVALVIAIVLASIVVGLLVVLVARR